MRMRPVSSNISASIIPGLSRKSATSISPFRTASTASRLHSGHNDEVLLGTPVAIGIRSRCFGSRLGAQLGLGKFPSGKAALMACAANHAAFVAARTTGVVIRDMSIYLQLNFSWKDGIDLQSN